MPGSDDLIDVGISPIDHAWDFLVERKGKRAVDLDTVLELRWTEITNAKACGWLDNYKEQTPDSVVTKGVEVIAEMASSISPDRPQFTLHSQTAEANHPSLSGISGGVVLALQDNVEVPFGIVFEGFPGNPVDEANSHDAYLKPGDLMVRGHVLTPTVFETWLRNLK